MLLGAGIALILILVFLLGVDNPKPEWGKLWMLKPLIVVPTAGAMGGVFYYFMD
ncbi:potassium transporter KefB, partial [Bacillus toyonensis]